MASPTPVLSIGHFIPYLGRAQGGPVFNLASCAASQAEAGCKVSVLTVARSVDGPPISLDQRVEVVLDDRPGWGTFRRCPGLRQRARSFSLDVVHSHGLWTDVNRLAYQVASERHLPHLLTPCGTLAPGALRHHWWKKAPVKAWFQVRALRQANCLQAQSESEYNDVRRFGLRNPVAIIPAAVAGPPRTALPPNKLSGLDRNTLVGKKIVLYLGRLHRVKGVARLIAAWSSLPSFHRDWLLVLAGPDEGGMRPGLEAALRASGCAESVVFTGQLDEQKKWAAYQAADLFVMPSDFENFGISIVEAMLSGLPVVTTMGTPWKELGTAGAGWWVQPAVEALTRALREAFTMSDDQRRVTGKRAAVLAAKFSPEQAAADLIHVYHWLLHENPSPACVRLD